MENICRKIKYNNLSNKENVGNNTKRYFSFIKINWKIIRY